MGTAKLFEKTSLTAGESQKQIIEVTNWSKISWSNGAAVSTPGEAEVVAIIGPSGSGEDNVITLH